MNIRKPQTPKEWAIAAVAALLVILVGREVYLATTTPDSVKQINEGTDTLRKNLESLE